jgi:hypothetical protein
MTANDFSLLLKDIRKNKILRDQLSQARNLYHAAAIAQEAGYAVTWKDWMRYQAEQALLLNAEEMDDYCKRLANGIEVFDHATFIPVFGLLCKDGAFQWVIPFDADEP